VIAKRRIQVGEFVIGQEERDAINAVLDSGRISEGPKVAQFEREFASYIGTKYCVAVNSGTSALLAALYTIKQLYKSTTTDVLTHKVTFIATHNAIIATGFKPVFKGKADIAIPVHLMGYPSWLDAKYIIEDCSQAHGSQYYLDGPKVGTKGLMGTFSFYIAHNIQAGEMGAVVTNSLECYRTLRKIKAHGRVCDCLICKRAEGACPRPLEPDPRFTYDMFGLNFKTMEFTAALALCQIKKADEIKMKRLFNVAYLNEGLSDIKEIIGLPEFKHNVSYLAYPINCKGMDRGIIRQALEDKGIESRPLFNDPSSFYIGCHQYLTTEDLDFIISVLHSVLHA
jgi:perosamine synthetase